MARDTGKALDNVLDWANELKARIQFSLVQIEMFRESGGLTANEMVMLNTIQGHLEDPGESE